MKFKFKKKVLKLEISTFKSLLIFLSLYEFDNFYIKITSEKDEKFCGFVCAQNKFEKIFDYLSWKLDIFSTKRFF